MTDAAPPAARDARLAWLVGGSLLIAYSALTLATSTALPILHVPGVAIFLDLLWAAALILFAFGIRRSGSMVARQPLGMVSLVVAAVLPLVSTVALPLLPWDSLDRTMGVAIGETLAAVSFAALLVATVVLGRARAVPHRFRWVPLIVLLAVAAAQVVAQLAAVSAANSGDSDLAALVQALSLTPWLAILLLGVLAVVFAPREPAHQPVDQTVQIYPSV